MDQLPGNRRQFIKSLSMGAAAVGVGVADSAASAQGNPTHAPGINSRVESIEVTLKESKPNPDPIRDALQSLPGVGSVQVKVTSDDGISGNGEIGYGRIPAH